MLARTSFTSYATKVPVYKVLEIITHSIDENLTRICNTSPTKNQQAPGSYGDATVFCVLIFFIVSAAPIVQ